MKTSENEAFQKRVIFCFENVAGRSKVNTVKHFQIEGKSRSTINDIINRYLTTNHTEYIKSVGHPVTVGTSGMKKKVLKTFKKNPSISVRAAAKKLKITPSTLQQIKKKDLGIKGYTKKVAPKYVKDQEQRAKRGCQFVYKKSLEKVMVIDDETYVPWDPQDVPGRKFFHAQDPKEVPYNEKVKPKPKFFKKCLCGRRWMKMATYRSRLHRRVLSLQTSIWRNASKVDCFPLLISSMTVMQFCSGLTWLLHTTPVK